jgi:hypothetical protein
MRRLYGEGENAEDIAAERRLKKMQSHPYAPAKIAIM